MKQLCIGTAVLVATLVAAPVLGYAQAVLVPNLDPYMDTGKIEYQSQCAICHGELGKGDGSFNVLLKKKASDLTVLSKNNGGLFPFKRMNEIISGTTDVAGHGPRNMPIWGNYYNARARSELSAGASQTEVRSFVRARILALVEYISILQASDQTGAGWVTLFDGKNLDNWNKIGDANWRLEDGVVVADKGNGFLVSKNTYTDFQLRAEFWVDADANSGIFIRCADPNKVTGSNAYEVNIWDTRPEPSYGTGAIVDLSKVDPMPKAGGKWNVYEITAKGSTLTVTLNGQKTASAQDGKFAGGRIALQHGLGVVNNGVANDKGVVKFRKVEIKPL